MPALVLLASPGAEACSSCGCTLSSDWAAQGYTASSGFRLDIRFDSFDQDQLRTGTGRVPGGGIALPSEREIQKTTINRNTTLALDFAANAEWGVSVLVPFFDRYHTTFAPGDTELSTSDFSRLGDVRILARYQGFSAEHTTGVQGGVKLATGAIDEVFSGGPQAGTPLDRGLQPGTGTYDLLVGAYHYGTLAPRLTYFAQALLQQPMNSRDAFRPGTGLNLNLGVRYLGNASLTPQMQLNIRAERRETGANADTQNSGAVVAYLGPGVTVGLGHGLLAYAFVQLPVYQNVNGYQLEPRYTASVGLHFQP